MHRLRWMITATALLATLGVAVVAAPTARPAGFLAAPAMSNVPAANYPRDRTASAAGGWGMRADETGAPPMQVALPARAAPLRAESARVEQVALAAPAPRAPGLSWTQADAPLGELQS